MAERAVRMNRLGACLFVVALQAVLRLMACHALFRIVRGFIAVIFEPAGGVFDAFLMAVRAECLAMAPRAELGAFIFNGGSVFMEERRFVRNVDPVAVVAEFIFVADEAVFLFLPQQRPVLFEEVCRRPDMCARFRGFVAVDAVLLLVAEEARVGLRSRGGRMYGLPVSGMRHGQVMAGNAEVFGVAQHAVALFLYGALAVDIRPF